MVTRAQLDRLSSRIDALAPRPGAGIAVIFARAGETEDQARARHYLEHPGDRANKRAIIVMFVVPRGKVSGPAERVLGVLLRDRQHCDSAHGTMEHEKARHALMERVACEEDRSKLT